MSVAWVGAAATVVGGAMAADATGDAADAQEAGAARADATQRYQFDTTREDNKPFRETGVAANNRLAFLMGLGGSATEPGPGRLTGSRLVEQGASGPTYNAELYSSNAAYRNAWDAAARGHAERFGRGYQFDSDANDIEASLHRALQDEFAKEAQENALAAEASKTNPGYGSLLRNFTMADRDADPVYQSGLQFGLNEGVKGINRLAAATGSFQSGATLKALTRFGNDYGSTKANESYNRFENNKNSTYNKLAGLSGAGQQATNQVSAAGQNMANNISQNQIGMGNARAASAIGQSNALTGAIGQGYNMYQQQQMMNRLFPTGGNSMAGYNGGYSNLAYDVGNMS